MFVDKAEIYVKGGDGGSGVISFRREKYVPFGGPDGGDGGKGGNVILEVNSDIRTLMDFRYKRKYVAKDGENGGGNQRTGKNGEDILVYVPEGTILKDADNGEILADLTKPGQKAIVARGGRGGRGNRRFASSTMKAPKFAESGQKGEEHTLILELKLLADVGLIGLPNVGKSTILSVLTKAKPKIANYPFTTLYPNLGVVEAGDNSFVIADIPGIIEGAHEGVGLGYDFLRHIERTNLLIHVIDASGTDGSDPIDNFDKVNNEMKMFNEEIIKKKQIVAVNKMDIPDSRIRFEKISHLLKERGYIVYPISAATGMGLKDLLHKISELLKNNRTEDTPTAKSEIINIEYKPRHETEFDTYLDEDGRYVLTGRYIDKLMSKVNINDIDSLRYLQKMLSSKGIFKYLRDKGIKDGDIIKIKDYELEFRE